MNQNDKYTLYTITSIFDITLLLIIYSNDLKYTDNIWIGTVYTSHILFYNGLYYNKRNIINMLHPLIFIVPFSSVFVYNIYIKVLSLLLIILVQFLWIIENRCILNESNETFGYGNSSSYLAILITNILSMNIGYTYLYIKNMELLDNIIYVYITEFKRDFIPIGLKGMASLKEPPFP